MVGMSREFKKYEIYRAYHWLGHLPVSFHTYGPDGGEL